MDTASIGLDAGRREELGPDLTVILKGSRISHQGRRILAFLNFS